MDRDDTAAGQRLSDEGLLSQLRELFHQLDPPPAEAVELAKQSFGLRTVDAELAELVADSETVGTAVAVRRADDGTRWLTFETAGAADDEGVAVEIEVARAGRDRRFLGQLIPPGPARIELRQPAVAARRTDADRHGRFVIEAVRPGPFSLICHPAGRRPIVTDWTVLG